MPRYLCHRKECTRIRSEFSIFLNRKKAPVYQGKTFCSEACLRLYFEAEVGEKWRRLQVERKRRIPRPRLGTILMETAAVTRDQIDEAVRLQSAARKGRIGEWLQRLGYVEEHQITEALAKQYGLPLINLNKSHASVDAVRMVPGMVAKCSGIIPVGFDDTQDSLRVAVSAPVDFGSQEAIRRMVGKGIVAYVGDSSAIERLLDQWYQPEDLDISNIPTFGSLADLIDIGNDIIARAINLRAEGIQAELVHEFFWIRLDFPSESHHHFFRYLSAPDESQESVPERSVAVGETAWV